MNESNNESSKSREKLAKIFTNLDVDEDDCKKEEKFINICEVNDIHSKTSLSDSLSFMVIFFKNSELCNFC